MSNELQSPLSNLAQEFSGAPQPAPLQEVPLSRQMGYNAPPVDSKISVTENVKIKELTEELNKEKAKNQEVLAQISATNTDLAPFIELGKMYKSSDPQDQLKAHDTLSSMYAELNKDIGEVRTDWADNPELQEMVTEMRIDGPVAEEVQAMLDKKDTQLRRISASDQSQRQDRQTGEINSFVKMLTDDINATIPDQPSRDDVMERLSSVIRETIDSGGSNQVAAQAAQAAWGMSRKHYADTQGEPVDEAPDNIQGLQLSDEAPVEEQPQEDLPQHLMQGIRPATPPVAPPQAMMQTSQNQLPAESPQVPQGNIEDFNKLFHSIQSASPQQIDNFLTENPDTTRTYNRQ